MIATGITCWSLCLCAMYVLKSGYFMVPTGTGNLGKPGKMGRHFPVGEKSGNFVKTGKVGEKLGNFTQNTGKIGKNYTGKVREICQPVIVKTLQIWYHTLNKKRTLKNAGKVGEICQSKTVETMYFLMVSKDGEK